MREISLFEEIRTACEVFQTGRRKGMEGGLWMGGLLGILGFAFDMHLFDGVGNSGQRSRHLLIHPA